MAMPIHQLASPSGAALYYDANFRTTLESHLDYLKNHPETRLIQLDPHDAYKYEFDLCGLLSKLGLPQQYHWVVMRVNEMVSPQQLTEETTRIKIPSINVIENIKLLYTTANKG